MAGINLPRSIQEAGYNARQNALANNQDAYELNKAMFMAPANILGALGHGVVEFGRGFFGGAPTNATMVNVAPPVARAAAVPPQPASGVPVTPLTAENIGQYGTLSPAARAVLGHVNPQAAQAADAAYAARAAQTMQGAPSLLQMMAGYAGANGGKISLRAIGALSDAALKGASASAATARGNTAPRIADIAGAQAMQLGEDLYNQRQQQAMQTNDKAQYLKNVLEQRDFYERLARARAVDPLSANNFYGPGE